jgi:hypothetical protein
VTNDATEERGKVLQTVARFELAYHLVVVKKVDANPYRAGCSIGKADFNISNIGICAVTSHEKGKKHEITESNADLTSKTGQQTLHGWLPTSQLCTLGIAAKEQTAHKTEDTGFQCS